MITFIEQILLIDTKSGGEERLKNGWHKNQFGNQEHYVNGVLHNDSGPAFISPCTSYCAWWFNGVRHREDGPARQSENTKNDEWWYNGVYLGSSWQGFSKEKFEVWKRFKAFH